MSVLNGIINHKESKENRDEGKHFPPLNLPQQHSFSRRKICFHFDWKPPLESRVPLYLLGASQLTKHFAIFFICFFYSQGWTDFTQDRTARHTQAGLGLRGIHMQFRLNAFLRTKGVTMWRAIELKSGKGDFFFFFNVKPVIDSRGNPSLSVSLWQECITWTSELACTNGQEAFVSHGQWGCADIEATEDGILVQCNSFLSSPSCWASKPGPCARQEDALPLDHIFSHGTLLR